MITLTCSTTTTRNRNLIDVDAETIFNYWFTGIINVDRVLALHLSEHKASAMQSVSTTAAESTSTTSTERTSSSPSHKIK